MKHLLKTFLFIILCGLFFYNTQAQTVSTIAGSGSIGSTNGIGLAASFNYPRAVAVDASGNIFVADRMNHRIRKITAAGVVTTYAGTGVNGAADGPAASATFTWPAGVCLDAAGNVYVIDEGNYKIRKISTSGIVSTVAGAGVFGNSDGTGAAASFGGLSAMCIDGSGNIYVTDAVFHNIRKITPTGVVTTIAGSGINGSADGVGTSASFFAPSGICIDAAGNLYVSDLNNHKIRKITPLGVVTTIAGTGLTGSMDGAVGVASFNQPAGIAVDAAGNLFVSDSYNHKIRKITPAGMVSTYAGTGSIGVTDGPGAFASFNYLFGICLDNSGNMFIADQVNHRIRKITAPLPGASLNFDGTDDMVIVGSSAMLTHTSTDPLTMEAWVYPTNLLATRGIIRKDGDYNLSLSNGLLYADIFTTGSSFISATTTTPLPINQWTHVAAVWNGAALSLYVNGNLETATMSTGSAIITGNLTLGASNSFGHFFEGNLDEVTLWGRVLCEDEIQHGMNCEIDPAANALIVAYHFNSGYAGLNNSGSTTLTDAGPNALDGSLSGFALNGGLSNWLTPGAVMSGTMCTTYSDVITASIIDQQNVSCPGESDGWVSLLATGSGTLSYYWVPFGGSSNIATNLPAGSYSCNITSECGAMEIINVSITEPLIDMTVTQAGPNFTANQAGATYQWIDCENGNASIPGATAQAYTTPDEGMYAVIVTLGGCSDTSACYTYENSGFEDNPSDLISVYPNPGNGALTIESSTHGKFSVTDVTGRVVCTGELNQGLQLLDLTHEQRGVYFLQVITAQGTQIKQLVIQQQD